MHLSDKGASIRLVVDVHSLRSCGSFTAPVSNRLPAFSLREGMFENSTTVSGGERVWSRCDGTQTFTFSSWVKIQSANRSATRYIDYEWESMNGLWLQLGLQWRECAA